MKSRLVRYDSFIFVIGTACLILLVVSDILYEITQQQISFGLLTILLLIYVGWETRRIFRTERWNVLVIPPVLASIITFVLMFGVSNYLLLGSIKTYPYLGILGKSPFDWLNKAMICVLIAAFAMWRGYYFPIGRNLGRRTSQFLLSHGLIRHKFKIKWGFLIFCIIASIFARVIQTSLGIFGYSSEISQLYALAEYKQYLDLAAGLGRLALIGIAFAYFSGAYLRSYGLLFLFAIVLILEVGFGFLSGFKGQAAFPFVIVGLCYYITKQQIPKYWIIAVLVTFVLAYQVIEPFRYIRYSKNNFNNRDITEIASTMGEILVSKRETGKNYLELVFERMNLTSFTAISIAYKDKVDLDDADPDFVRRILFSPAYAYIPRLIWSSKPYSNIGYWYNVKVLRSPEWTKTSVAMSPVSYLYFAGGMIAVFIGFTLIGITQRFVYEAFAKSGGGGWVIYLGVLGSLVMVDSDVGSIFTTVFRFAPIMLVGQYLLFRSEAINVKSLAHS